MSDSTVRRLNPNKLLLSKWTAALPKNKEKHFLVTQLIKPDLPDAPIEHIELEAVYSRRYTALARPDRYWAMVTRLAVSHIGLPNHVRTISANSLT